LWIASLGFSQVLIVAIVTEREREKMMSVDGKKKDESLNTAGTYEQSSSSCRFRGDNWSNAIAPKTPKIAIVRVFMVVS
jgi:hypothetical protein